MMLAMGLDFIKSSVAKRSVVIDGHKTSVSLEDAFWSGLREIAVIPLMARVRGR